jgi:hypothetical protein
MQNALQNIGVSYALWRSTGTAAAKEAFEDAVTRIVGLAMHEMTHAMGFTSESWPLFRNSQGMPYTSRDQTQPNVPAAAYKRQIPCQRQQLTVFTPDASTLSYSQERGSSTCAALTLSDPSMCVARIVTPMAQQASRTAFACSDLAGVEIENQPTSECGIMGSHVEQRVFQGSFMTSYTTQYDAVDAPTLGVMEDSSWWR